MPSPDSLIADAKSLYTRMQSGTLRPDDILSGWWAKYRKDGEILPKLRRDINLFNVKFPGFIGAYSPFRIFDEKSAVLDVGAHWGYSVVAMRHQGLKSRIHSIEALPQNTRELARLRKVEDGRYDFTQVAATETPCQLTFYIPAINGVAVTGLNSTGGTLLDYYAGLLASLVQTYPAKKGRPNRFQLIVVKVAGRPIDHIVDDLKLADSIVAIKMDVEGHEAPALRGARRLLGREKPMLMVEGANRDAGVETEMRSHGYQHHELRDSLLHLHEDISMAQDGYWLHPKHFEFYRQSGLMA
ncbi:MAG: FkbM family methyltransferase [Rhizobiaceae bacterium]